MKSGEIQNSEDAAVWIASLVTNSDDAYNGEVEVDEGGWGAFVLNVNGKDFLVTFNEGSDDA